MRRAQKVFAAAVLLSLVVHLILLGSAGRWWNLPATEVPLPIEAELVEAKPAPATVKPAQPRRVVAAPTPITAPPVAEPVPQAPLPAVESPASPPAVAAPAELAPLPAAAPTVPEPPSLPPAARQLPTHLVLRYAVQYGDGGFNLGTATYTWQLNNGHYVLVSVAEATGLISLFASGRIVQSSEGQVTDSGLQPTRFWMGRSPTKKESARFDWARHQLALPSGEVVLPDLTQDMMSFIFHLAMTVRESDSEWGLAVTNGSRLKDYRFRNLGAEKVQALGKEIDALHLQGTRPNEGGLEVWLGLNMHWLPARVRTVDNKGKAMVLTLTGIDG